MSYTQKTFVPTRKQLHRLSSIVSLLKQEGTVSLYGILEYFQEAKDAAGVALTCGAKTVYRDLQILRETYKCPFEYDASHRCYVLKDKQWDLPVPAILNDSELFAAVMGARFTQIIFPASIADRIKDTVDALMRSNTLTTLTASRLESLFILSTKPTVVSNKHFQTIFDAWSRCCRLDVIYKDTYGNKNQRVIEPHGLVYHGVNWYILAYCHKTQKRRIFSISRIQDAHVLETPFEPSPEIIDKFVPDELLVFGTVRDSVVKLTAAGGNAARKRPLHPEQELCKQDDGTYLLTVRVAAKKDAVSWVMQQCGEAVPLAPDKLVQAVKDAAQKLIKQIS